MTIRYWHILLLVWLFIPRSLQAAEPCAVWPAWTGFRDRYVGEGGRVIDRGSPQSITTSEGQSYGLFFALVANDRPGFESILRWTEDNLAGGDLTARLPAWQWGKSEDGKWGVLDDNAASDSDVWIAYALAEAGRLWKVERYSALAALLAERILREESEVLPGLGRTLLPGPKGFKPAKDIWRLNPSYVPLQVVQRLSVLFPKSTWRQLVPSSSDLVVRASPRGFAPEWILYKVDGGFQPDPDTQGEGSYNAIRVYLWAGMLAADDPLRDVLIKRLLPMAEKVGASGTPPEKVDTRSGVAAGTGSAGFSAALLPFLTAARQHELVSQQRLRVVAKAPLERNDNYYDQVLTLFGLGWLDGHYRFARDGSLLPRWTCVSPSPSS